MGEQTTLRIVEKTRLYVEKSTKQCLVNMLRAQNRRYVDLARDAGEDGAIFEYLTHRIDRVSDLADTIESQDPGEIPLTDAQWRLLSTTHRDYCAHSPWREPVPEVTDTLNAAWGDAQDRDSVDINRDGQGQGFDPDLAVCRVS